MQRTDEDLIAVAVLDVYYVYLVKLFFLSSDITSSAETVDMLTEYGVGKWS